MSTPSLSDAQQWAVQKIADRGGVCSASRLGLIMLDRPGLDTTGKRYSAYTLGRMGGGMFMHLRKRGLARTRKIHGKTVGVLTGAAYQYVTSDNTSALDKQLKEIGVF